MKKILSPLQIVMNRYKQLLALTLFMCPLDVTLAASATADDLARGDPDRYLTMIVSFAHIQRAPAIIDMLTGSGLILENVKYKHVGSGGGESGVGDPFGRSTPIVDTPEKVKAALDRIEHTRAKYFRDMARFKGGLREVDCPHDDQSSSVKDLHGVPGDPSIELSCGLRIVRIRVSGTARDGARLVSSHADIANVVVRPSEAPVPGKTAAAPAQRAATTLSGEELIEAAKLGLFEKMYESGAKTYRTQLAGRGLSAEEVEDRLFQAMDALALCVALAAQSQAREQGLSEEIVLKGFGTGTRGKEESQVLLQLDMEAFKSRTASCNKVMYDQLGLTFF